MDKLWAPWRMKCITAKNKTCIFCKAVKSRRDEYNYLLERERLSFSLLNIFPYNNGHVMVAPNRHISRLEELSDAELLDLFKLVNKTKINLDKTLRPDGFNIGMNIGKAGGAGFPGHIHVHIIPRWNNDTNFMPVIADTKVIPQSLKVLYKILKK